MTLEEGKPCLKVAMKCCEPLSISEWFAEEARRIDGRVVPSNRPGVLQLVKKKQLGRWPHLLRGISRQLPRHANSPPHWPQVAALF
jgi:hypothetical protein